MAVLVGLAVLLLRGDAEAQGNDLDREIGFLEAEEIARIPLDVVSRGPAIAAGEAPAVVDVITAEEIRVTGARTLAELLSQRVGFDVSQDAVVPRGLNTAPSTSLNPLENNRTLLLVDGRPANGFVIDEFLAGRELPLEHIARIEIIRGPGSALYGTNAMAGVINVVTKDAADLPLLGGIAEYGHFSARRADAFGGFGGPQRNGSFFFRYYEDAGTNQVRPNDDKRQFFGFARGTIGPVTLFAEALSFREENPGNLGSEDVENEDRTRHERYSIGASLRKKLGEAFRLAGQAYANLYQTRFLFERGEPEDRTVYDDNRIGQELTLTYEPWDWMAVTMGGETRLEMGGATVCNDGTGDFTRDCDFDRNVFAFFLEDQLRLPLDTALTAGVRYDDISSFGGRFSPRVNLLWQPYATAALKVGYGEAFRAPSFFELRAFQAFGDSLTGDPDQFVLGNPNLESEVVRTLDGEIAWRISRLLNVRVGGFFTRGSDLISQQDTDLVAGILQLCPPICIPIVSPPADTQFLFVNTDRVEVAGLELGFGGVWSRGLPGKTSWGVNYTLQDATTRFRNPDTQERVEIDTPLVPTHKVNLLLDYRPVRDLSLFWHLRWVGSRPTGLADQPERLQGFFNHTLSFVYRLTPDVDLGLGIYNVLDDERRVAATVPREPLTFLASLGVRVPSRPRVPALAQPGREPSELHEARVAVERAREAGAERLALTSYKEAAAHLIIAEELQRKGAPSGRVVAAAGRAVRAAEVAREMARTHGTPLPEIGAPSPASPTPARPPGTQKPALSPTPARPPGTPGIVPIPAPTRAAEVTPTPAPTAPPLPTPTPTPDVSRREVLLLQSDGEVAIYRSASAALTAALPARVRFHDLGGDPERGGEVLAEEGGEVDLIVAVGSLAASLAREGGRGRPVLYCAVLNPERYAAPAGNVGGVSFEVSAVEQLRGLRRALPGRTRIGVIYDPEKSGATVAAAEQAAGRLGLRIVKQRATRAEDVDFLFRSLRNDIDVLWLLPDSTVVTRESFELLALQAAEAGIPLVAFAEAFARQGALLAFYPDPAAVGRQCGALATRILRGEVSPAEIGARSPDRFACAVNRRIEGQLGVSVPGEMCAEVGG